MIFLVNAQNHYFSIDSTVLLNKDYLSRHGCHLFESLEKLYSYLNNKLDLEFEELEGNEIHILSQEGDIKFLDGRGCSIAIETPIDNFLSSFKL